MEKKVLITGGGGMVGSAMESPIKLTREYCDLTNPRQTNSLFRAIKPDGIIHCAGKVGGIGGNSNYKGEYFYDN
jgi:dTDP-4-dehydrorhamnose reductase